MLSSEELVDLSKRGGVADLGIEKIKKCHFIYDLSPSQIIALNQQGVELKVLNYIDASREAWSESQHVDKIHAHEKQINLEKFKRSKMIRLYSNTFDYEVCPYRYRAF